MEVHDLVPQLSLAFSLATSASRSSTAKQTWLNPSLMRLRCAGKIDRGEIERLKARDSTLTLIKSLVVGMLMTKLSNAP
jgi:hypothetical protein